MKKSIRGICRLCGKNGLLSYEHVPPRSAFNDKLVKIIKGEQIIEDIGIDQIPKNISQLKGEIHQQGAGGYYLCKDCNAKTGSWYVPYFREFIHDVAVAIEKTDPNREEKRLIIQTDKVRPLAIIKQVMVMFCDINNGCFGDENLREFLLNKDRKEGFDKKKYRVFCYLTKSEPYRMNGLSVTILSSRGMEPIILQLSEISFYPLGFVLYIDLPDEYKPLGCEITDLADSNYNDLDKYVMLLSVLENNTMFSGDYRTQEDIDI